MISLRLKNIFPLKKVHDVMTTMYKLITYGVMKYYVLIYQSLVKTSNGLNKKTSKNSSECVN